MYGHVQGSVIGMAAAILLASSTVLPLRAQDLPDAYRDGPYYGDLMGDIARLQVIGRLQDESEVGCSRDYTAPNPCSQVKKVLDEIIEKHGLPADVSTVVMLNAYAEGEYEKADKLYAAARGYALPDHLADDPGSGTAAAIASYGVRPKISDDTSCTNDPMGSKPCPEVVTAFNAFTREHGLPANAQTAKMFAAFADGDRERGERLYAALTGDASAIAETPNELLAEVRSYGVPVEEGTDTACRNNYYAAKPCPRAVSAWRAFARQHDLELNQQTADLFQAYVEGDTVTGDKLYAAAKGISVAELLYERGAIKEDPGVEPLYVPIHPPGR